MRTHVVAEAEAELAEAIARYEETEPGLGVRLKEEVRAVIAWIGEHPLLPRLRPPWLSSRKSRSFPLLCRLRRPK